MHLPAFMGICYSGRAGTPRSPKARPAARLATGDMVFLQGETRVGECACPAVVRGGEPTCDSRARDHVSFPAEGQSWVLVRSAGKLTPSSGPETHHAVACRGSPLMSVTCPTVSSFAEEGAKELYLLRTHDGWTAFSHCGFVVRRVALLSGMPRLSQWGRTLACIIPPPHPHPTTDEARVWDSRRAILPCRPRFRPGQCSARGSRTPG